MSKTTVTDENRLSDEDKYAFIDRRLVARIGTVNGRGEAHVTPIWYLWKDGAFYLILGKTRLHLKNMMRDPRATMCIDLDPRIDGTFGDGAQGVVMFCDVELSTSDELRSWLYPEIAEMYGVADDPSYITARDSEERICAILRPNRDFSWDFTKGSA
jgi:hypothetical protein